MPSVLTFVKGWETVCVCVCFSACLCLCMSSVATVFYCCASIRNLRVHLCVRVYSRSDRINPVACESELFIVWKPMRLSILSVTNDYLPPCIQTQTSCFSIWTARVVGPCLFYVFTCVESSEVPQIMHWNINYSATVGWSVYPLQQSKYKCCC